MHDMRDRSSLFKTGDEKVITIQICEHCGAVKDAETPSEVVQTLKKVGWELKRAEGKPRTTNVETKAPKKKETREETREENSNHVEAEEPVMV
jgi:uncharacterized protein YchJ